MRVSLSSLLVANLCLADPRLVGSEPYPTTVCERTSQELFGRPPLRIAASESGVASDPKRIRHAKPRLPRKWPPDCRAMATVHEALIAPSGSVEHVYTIRSPCPAIDRLVSAAIKQWKYTPTLVEGKAVPVCLAVTTRIHPR
jgi:hypothetical protein